MPAGPNLWGAGVGDDPHQVRRRAAAPARLNVLVHLDQNCREADTEVLQHFMRELRRSSFELASSGPDQSE